MVVYYSSFLFFLGIVFGSFLNALEWRLRNKLSLLERSACVFCKQKIAWYDNIPIVSFFVLGQKCRHCKKNISWQYPLVELWMGFIFVFTFVMYGYSDLPALVKDLFIVFVLTFIFVYDLKYQEILDVVTLPSIIIIFVFSLIFVWHSWQSMLLGLLIGGGFFLAQYIVSKGRWIGGGDIRLGALMGVILGWQLVFVALFFAYIVGAIVSLTLVGLKKKNLASKTPFGTYLAVATLFAMLYGESVLSWYLGLIF